MKLQKNTQAVMKKAELNGMFSEETQLLQVKT